MFGLMSKFTKKGGKDAVGRKIDQNPYVTEPKDFKLMYHLSPDDVRDLVRRNIIRKDFTNDTVESKQRQDIYLKPDEILRPPSFPPPDPPKALALDDPVPVTQLKTIGPSCRSNATTTRSDEALRGWTSAERLEFDRHHDRSLYTNYDDNDDAYMYDDVYMDDVAAEVATTRPQLSERATMDTPGIPLLPEHEHPQQNRHPLFIKRADKNCASVIAAKIDARFRQQENIGRSANESNLSRSVDDLRILRPTTGDEHQVQHGRRPLERELEIASREASPSSRPVGGNHRNNSGSASDHRRPSGEPSPQPPSENEVWTPARQQPLSPQPRSHHRSYFSELSPSPFSRNNDRCPSKEHTPRSPSRRESPTLRNDLMSPPRELPPRSPSRSERRSPTWQPSSVPLTRNDHRIPSIESQYAERAIEDRITQLSDLQHQNQQSLHVKRADGKCEPVVAAKIKARFRQQENIVRNRSGSVDELRVLRPTTPLNFDADHQIRHQRRPSESEIEIPSRHSSRPVGGNQRNNSRTVSDHWRPSRETSPQPPSGNEVWTAPQEPPPPLHSGSYNRAHPNEQPPRPPSDHWGYIKELPHRQPARREFWMPSCHPSSSSVEGHLDNELNSRYGTPLENQKQQPFPSMDYIQILIPTRQPNTASRNEIWTPTNQQLYSPNSFMSHCDNELSSRVNTSLEKGENQKQYQSQSGCNTSRREDAIQIWIPAREPSEQLGNSQASVKHQGVQLRFNLTHVTDVENRNLPVAHQTNNKKHNASPEETTGTVTAEVHKTSHKKEVTSVPPYSQMDYLSGPSDANRQQDEIRRAEHERKPHTSNGVEHESTISKASKLFGVRLRHGDLKADTSFSNEGRSPTNWPFSRIRATTPSSRRPSWTIWPEDGFSGSTRKYSSHYRDPLVKN